MHIKEEHQKIILGIISHYFYKYDFFAFGSRVYGRHLHDFSDLDLLLKRKSIETSEQESNYDICSLKDSFSESWLPFKVDLTDWESITDNFKTIITEDLLLINNLKIESKN